MYTHFVISYLFKKNIAKILKTIGRVEYKNIIAKIEYSFMFCLSKPVNSKVINDIARAKARDSFVIIAQKPNKTEVKSSFFL